MSLEMTDERGEPSEVFFETSEGYGFQKSFG